MTDVLAGTTWTFPCGHWFDKTKEDGAIERDLLPEAGKIEQSEARIPYDAVFYTSDIRHAGTSAHGEGRGRVAPRFTTAV